MKELHYFKNAKQTKILFSEFDKNISAKELMAFLCNVCSWIHTNPLVHRITRKEDNAVYFLFRDFSFAAEEFWTEFGNELAALYSKWQVDVFGTMFSAQEAVWMTIEKCDNQCYAVQKTISGKPAEIVQSLCLKIKCASAAQAESIQALFQSIDCQKGIIAADWKYHEFFVEGAIECFCQNTCFCYGSLYGNASAGDYLNLLNFDQKTVLWSDFLKDNFDYKEFEWLYNEIISNSALKNRSEWELSLYSAMQNLGYTMQISDTGFELYNGQGKRCYFNFNSPQNAQRAFLKMLFPINK